MVNVDGQPDTKLGNSLGYMSKGVVGSAINREGISVPKGYKITEIKYSYSYSGNIDFSSQNTITGTNAKDLINKANFLYKTYKKGTLDIIYNIVKIDNPKNR